MHHSNKVVFHHNHLLCIWMETSLKLFHKIPNLKHFPQKIYVNSNSLGYSSFHLRDNTYFYDTLLNKGEWKSAHILIN